MTRGQFLKVCSERLKGVSPSATLDAQVLVMHCLGVDRTALIVDEGCTVSITERDQISELVDRRVAGTPIAHLTGEREFWSLPLTVTPAVLIPRPDTEQLVEQTLECLQSGDRLADLGTGSGAIGIAVAFERPDVEVIATDISDSALEVARGNAERLGLSNITFRSGHWLDALESEPFNVIASNPPYIGDKDPHLHKGDLRYEPRGALVARAQGLADLFEIIDRAAAHLTEDGSLLLEHGFDQGIPVRNRLATALYQSIETIHDLGGNERVTRALAPTR